MQQNEFLANDPLAALKLTPMALQGGGASINKGDPLMDMAKAVGQSYLMAYGGTTKVPQNYMSGTTMVPQNYMSGIDEIPGQRTAQDTVPAMLSPGEAVIPASAAQDPANQGAIEGMVQEGREDQGMAAQILQSLGLPPQPELVAMIEDMLAQGIPPEAIVQQLKERIGQQEGGQEMPQEAPMAPPQAPMDAPMGEAMAPMGETMAPQGAPMAPLMEPPVQDTMGMPQGLYGGSSGVQGPLSGKKQREQNKFDSDEYRKNAAFQSDQQRKNEMHRSKMNGE